MLRRFVAYALRVEFKVEPSLTTVGGSGGIRTHERVAPLLVFKTSAFNHSATLPYRFSGLAAYDGLMGSFTAKADPAANPLQILPVHAAVIVSP